MSSQVSRRLGRRTGDSVSRLLEAALAEVREVGYDGLTVRSVAARAEVSPATAYTYFASKDHLVAEVFGRVLRERPRVSLRGPLRQRLTTVFRDLADLLAGEPALAAAVTVALLSQEPDVQKLQLMIGSEIDERIRAALRPGELERDPARRELLTLAWLGAMLQAGMGHTTYDEMGDQLARAVGVVVGGRR